MRFINNIYGIDYRSLTLFRQLIALIYIFFVFIIRISYFEYFSVEDGPFSNEVMSVIENAPLLCKIIQTDFGLIVYLVFCLIVGILLFLGIFPSLSAFTAMFLYITLARRFFPYYFGTDELMVVILFCLGFVYIIDNKKIQNKNYINIRNNPYVLLLLLQVAIIYGFNGINKTDISWFQGKSVHMAIFNVLFNKPFGIYFLQFPFLCKIFTYVTHLFELSFIVLIFFPYKQKYFRIFVAIGILAFHWGIHLFADVTFYKYTGLAFFILLMPAVFWDKFYWLHQFVIDKNIRLNKGFSIKLHNRFAICCSFILLLLAINTSINRQNERYKFITNNTLKNINNFFVFDSYSPLRQYWFMFAPSAPKHTGYIAFEYVNDSIIDNINIYGNKMPKKDFCYMHPFHICMILQYRSFDSELVSQETQFVLFNLFNHEIHKNRVLHPERKEDQYAIVSYRQSYNDFVKNNCKYNFERKVIANYQ